MATSTRCAGIAAALVFDGEAEARRRRREGADPSVSIPTAAGRHPTDARGEPSDATSTSTSRSASASASASSASAASSFSIASSSEGGVAPTPPPATYPCVFENSSGDKSANFVTPILIPPPPSRSRRALCASIFRAFSLNTRSRNSDSSHGVTPSPSGQYVACFACLAMNSTKRGECVVAGGDADATGRSFDRSRAASRTSASSEIVALSLAR